jgi:hypothetical protein
MTAMLALVSAAGLAGMVQAQTMAPPTTQPAQGVQGTAPSNQYQSTAAPNYQTAPAGAATTAPQAGVQQPTTMQQPTAMQQSTTMQQPTAMQQSTTMQQPTAMQPSTSAVSSRSLTRDDLMQAQQQLQAQGLYRGPIDGVMGSGTRRALVQFQRQSGLPVTASLDQQTLDSLSGGGLSSTANPSMGASTANPSMGASTPPVGTGAPIGTSAPGGTSSQTYNSPSTPGTQNTYTQPNTSSQPATR